MRWCLAAIASATLIFDAHAPAFVGQPAEMARPDAEAVVAVAIGLALADSRTIELPVTVEITPNPPAQPVEWIRTCGPNGCQLTPRPAPPSETQTASEDASLSFEHGSGAASASSSSGDDQPKCDGDGCGLRGKRRFFGGR